MAISSTKIHEARIDPFGLFKKECENILVSSYAKLHRDKGVALPKIDIASTLEDPPNEEFGHLASSISFELARALKSKPMKVASDLGNEVRKAGKFQLVESVQPAEPGYLNFKANLPRLTQLTLDAIGKDGPN